MLKFSFSVSDWYREGLVVGVLLPSIATCDPAMRNYSCGWVNEQLVLEILKYVKEYACISTGAKTEIDMLLDAEGRLRVYVDPSKMEEAIKWCEEKKEEILTKLQHDLGIRLEGWKDKIETVCQILGLLKELPQCPQPEPEPIEEEPQPEPPEEEPPEEEEEDDP